MRGARVVGDSQNNAEKELEVVGLRTVNLPNAFHHPTPPHTSLVPPSDYLKYSSVKLTSTATTALQFALSSNFLIYPAGKFASLSQIGIYNIFFAS